MSYYTINNASNSCYDYVIKHFDNIIIALEDSDCPKASTPQSEQLLSTVLRHLF